MTSAAEPIEPADLVAAAVTAVPGVASLHAGMFGEVATYLPGHRVTGIRITDDGAEIHVTLHYGSSIRETASMVRDAAVAIVGGNVNVIVEDVVAPPALADLDGEPRP